MAAPTPSVTQHDFTGLLGLVNSIDWKSITQHGPLPSPPFIEVEGIYNFRDLGGWPSTLTSPHNNKPLSVRRNVVFRSAEPSRITEAGTALLTETLGVTTIYDLRSTEESSKVTATIPGTTRVLVPVFDDQENSTEALAALPLRYKDYTAEGSAGFVNQYANILNNGVKSYRKVFEHIRDEPGKGMLVHCAIGKDRTGVLCALVLRLAGVSDENVAREYSLTENGLAEYKEVVMRKLMGHELFKGKGRDELERVLSAKEENMRAMLGMLDEKFGGADGYLRDKLGFKPAEVTRIQANLVVEEPAVVGEDVSSPEPNLSETDGEIIKLGLEQILPVFSLQRYRMGAIATTPIYTHVSSAVEWVNSASTMGALKETYVNAKWTVLLAMFSTVPGY